MEKVVDEMKKTVFNMDDNQIKLSHELKNIAKAQGFNPVGIARVPGSERLQMRTAALQRWLEAGHHAEMKWMASPARLDVQTLLEGVQSILVVGLNYFTGDQVNKNGLLIARYAWGNDYHKVIEKRLKKIGQWLTNQRSDCKWKICVDSKPLLEKAWAEEAGIGWIGKNSNLINPKKGSWMVLGYLLCTESLIPDQASMPLCGNCQKCIEQCPTQAITEPFVINSKKCIAYHNIENRNQDLPLEIKKSMRQWIVGCDICQEVCPWNKKDTLTKSTDPDIQPKQWIINISQDDVINCSDEKWKEKLKGTDLKRIKPWMWKRNAKSINYNKVV